MSTLQEDLVLETIRSVIDPELGISIVELGLVYSVEVKENEVHVRMTLTSPACPLGGVIQAQVDRAVRTLPFVKDVNVALVWSPRWDPRTMASEDALMELGIL
jgi:metal-sulfur cluster biosynthetic enzyme